MLKQLQKCSNIFCCASRLAQSDEPCCLNCKGECQCNDCSGYRPALAVSANFFALQLLWWPDELRGRPIQDVLKRCFNLGCWTGNCLKPNCLKLKPFFQKFKSLFPKEQKFKFWKYQELKLESLDGKKPWLYHRFGKPEILSGIDYEERMRKLVEQFIPHLIALNFGNEQLRHVTDPKTIGHQKKISGSTGLLQSTFFSDTHPPLTLYP